MQNKQEVRSHETSTINKNRTVTTRRAIQYSCIDFSGIILKYGVGLDNSTLRTTT
ncbi:hypothetical protein [Brasilonema bromeliae]|uniref:hypothetical protein n=1 Tax=Brasilonema bromeliae TaxID=383615 RepID=UPI00145D8DE2|nr:hypothetical protein [Brasilonema bromeliae]